MNLNDLKKLVVLKPWVKPGEAAAILNVSRRRVWDLIGEDKLETINILGGRNVLLTSIIQRLEKRVKLSKKASALLQ